MLPIITRWANEQSGKRGKATLITTEKSAVGRVIPDLLIYTSPKNNKSISLKRSLSNYDCEVLAQICSKGPLNSQLLQELLYTKKERLHQAITTLLNKSLIRTSKEGILNINRARLPKASILSIEAKLTRWKDAIAQAQYYLSFSNAALIAMPTEVINKTPQLRKECQQHGLGLMAVDYISAQIIEKPQVRSQYSAKWFWLMDKLSNFSYYKTANT